MPRNDHSALIAEIGSVTTRVTLIDTVAGEARLVSMVEVPSTIEPPQDDATIAILAAAAEIGELTSRVLLDAGRLVMPQTNERDGVNAVIAVTSAAGLMGVVIAAVAADISGKSAYRASLSTYTSILQTITLDNSMPNHEGRDSSWIERQVQLLTGLNPDVVLITGGLEQGAQDSLVRLAHIVGLTSLSTRVSADGTQEQSVTARPVIFAGNNQASERVFESLSGRARLKIVENVRPTLTTERLDPARRELINLYEEQILPRLPGWSALNRITANPVRSAATASGLMTRFIAELTHRAILTVDVGASSTTLHYANAEKYIPTILGSTGSSLGVGALLEHGSVAQIARWLPFPIGERDLTHRLLNKMLRPQLQPMSREDLLIEQAIAREAIALGYAALKDEEPEAAYDLLIAGGGILAHAPTPGHAALAVIDALQIGNEKTLLAVDIHIDTLGLLTACGAMALYKPEAAIGMFERDLLNNIPLATCVATLGDGQAGTPAVEAELRIAGREPTRITVNHGQIAHLAIGPGERGQLILRPSAGIYIGTNTPGAEVASEVGAVGGSLLGVIIDARGRPLRLPEATATRQQMIWDWLVALGAESGPLPYETIAPPPDITPPMMPMVQPVQAPVAADASPSLDSDFVKLRQTVAEPKKGGLFRRGK